VLPQKLGSIEALNIIGKVAGTDFLATLVIEFKPLNAGVYLIQ
jgi:hypothetical protein